MKSKLNYMYKVQSMHAKVLRSRNKAIVSVIVDVGDEVADECIWDPQFSEYFFKCWLNNLSKNRFSN